jgi:ATP synthase protein I
VKSVEPEIEMVRRALPLGVVAISVAILVGLVLGGMDTALSAAAGGFVAFANLGASAWLIAWSGRRHPSLLALIVFGGFFVRMAAVFGVMGLLNLFPSFSPQAFIATLFPLAVLLLAFEAKVLAGPMGREVRIAPEQGASS